MTATERRQEILNTISTEGSVRASDLAERLNVTTETIRKDLIFLNNKHLLKKGHGGCQQRRGDADLVYGCGTLFAGNR